MQGMEEVEGGSSSLLMSSMSALPTLHENSELDLSDRPGPMSTSLLGRCMSTSQPLFFSFLEKIKTVFFVSRFQQWANFMSIFGSARNMFQFLKNKMLRYISSLIKLLHKDHPDHQKLKT
jgi:hypothetical protein